MDRLSRYFLRRLHHLGRRAMIRHAITNGLINVKIKEIEGHMLRRFEPAFDTSDLVGDREADLATVGKRFGTFLRAQGGVKTGTRTVDAFQTSGIILRSLRAGKDFSPALRDDERSPFEQFGAPPAPQRDKHWQRDRRSYGVDLIGRLAIPPKVPDVAACLVLAHAVVDSRVGVGWIRQVLQQPAPIIALYISVEGIESVMLRLLEAGVIVREPMAGATGDYVFEPMPFDFEENEAKRRFVHFFGESFHHSNQTQTRKRIGQALDAGYPVIAVSAQPDKVPEHIGIAADLSLFSDGLSWPIIVDLIEATTGISGNDVLEASRHWPFEPHDLSMDDLALSIRPGRKAAMILSVMENLASRNKAADEDRGDSKTRPTPAPRKEQPSEPIETLAEKRRRQDIEKSGPVVEVIEPADIPQTPDGMPTQAKTVENLVGYGNAKLWALDLKADLALYREGALAWSDMSTKLLLSGPPGTGKTLFAQALCNSLQIPMLVTSVSTWLQGGHLDGVLGRMASAFAKAREKAPCILFIDEIDGIGTRPSPEKDYADYWTAVVNKALELLDGSVKTEGVVVVGATNRPDQIDPAIRRSGRLEKHIIIPHPDIDTLEGIFRHHLRGDADGMPQASRKTVTGDSIEARNPDGEPDDPSDSTPRGEQQ